MTSIVLTPPAVAIALDDEAEPVSESVPPESFMDAALPMVESMFEMLKVPLSIVATPVHVSEPDKVRVPVPALVRAFAPSARIPVLIVTASFALLVRITNSTLDNVVMPKPPLTVLVGPSPDLIRPPLVSVSV